MNDKSKDKRLAGDFKNSFVYDNRPTNDWTKKGSDRRKPASTMQRTTLRTTADSFITSKNNYKTFLDDQEELPRLSILDNYRQIMRIMTNSYIEGLKLEKKYRNRDAKDIMQDEQYAKYKEEEVNTRKMSTILKSLNTTKKKRSVTSKNSNAPQSAPQQQEPINQNIR
eukprot:CAMPEP_0176348228 /NCGR_PEP_ID=MMETSP0126-20121128/7694_1 /TAXON_ID=141414 ORGANISM="Strombidinopsis acuminatum, Strain SPMC142" /NCGR_SAMPLE_ID=MMETSP0126 /ASSEMBLY_ACC=CAM_ASM_000229 /LENGTH=167 /DNA_ID=CAMNT_0017696887 /DNA_START=531 /DNA_END=1034 /DNA_ORIENTATION=-